MTTAQPAPRPRPLHPDHAALAQALAAGDTVEMALALHRISRSIIQSQGHKIPRTLDYDDLAQEATIDALRHLAEKFDPAKGSLRAFVYGSVRLTILDRSRKEIRRTRPLRSLNAALAALR